MFRCEQLFSMLESSFKVCLPLKVRWRDVNKTNFSATPFCIFKPGFCIFKLELDRRLVCCPISTTLHSLTICFHKIQFSSRISNMALISYIFDQDNIPFKIYFWIWTPFVHLLLCFVVECQMHDAWWERKGNLTRSLMWLNSSIIVSASESADLTGHA